MHPGDTTTRQVVLVTGHYAGSKRKAGFHWLADAYWRAGWRVIYFTAAFSWLSWLRRDHRLQYGLHRRSRRLEWLNDRLGSYAWYTPWHPVKLPVAPLNRLAQPIFSRYASFPLGPIESELARSDLFIFESTAGLMLFDRFRTINADARMVYRVSDDMSLLRVHPLVVECEKRLAPQLDLISVPTEAIAHKFRGMGNVVLHQHGIRKDLFDQPTHNPYAQQQWEKNLIFVGVAGLDTNFIAQASRMFPQWGFHIIGPIGGLPPRENVIAYGEMPFEQTVAYLKHADIALHTLTPGRLSQTRRDSLKVIQYAYCRLPVVAPEFLRSERPNMAYYQPSDPASMQSALKAAATMPRDHAWAAGVRTWDEIASELAGENSPNDNNCSDAPCVTTIRRAQASTSFSP